MESRSLFCNRFSFLILLIAWFCFTSISSNVNVFNLTRLCMSLDETGNNATNYTEHQFNDLVMASAFGTLLATLPFNWLYTRFGARYVFSIASGVSILSTALIPITVRAGFSWLYFMRLIQGATYASDFAAMGLVCCRYSTLKQSAFFISVLTCYTSLSTLVSSPISGILCTSTLGWPWIYYFHSIACAVLTLLWLFFYRDDPGKNPFVSAAELRKINRSKSKAHINMSTSIPYLAILKDPLIWVIWMNAFFEIFSGVFSLMYQPSFLKHVLKFDIRQTGFLAISGPIFHIPLKFVFGLSSDKIGCISEVTKMRLFNTIAVFLPGFCYLGLAFIPANAPWYHVAMFSLIGVTFSAAGGGFYKTANLYSRQFSHFVIANIQVVKALTMLGGPLLMNIFVSEMSNHSQWRIIFILLAISVFISNILFCWLVTDKPAKFTMDSTKERAGATPSMDSKNETYT